MYRFLSSKGTLYTNLQHVVNNGFHPSHLEPKFPSSICSYCRNTLNNHVIPEKNSLLGGVRSQSTRTNPTQKLSKKKSKIRYPRTYVELLEVNENKMTQTKAHVSKLKAFHLSKLASRPEVTLEHLHVLKQKKVPAKKSVSAEVDLDLLKSIEMKILSEPASAANPLPEEPFEEKYAITFTPEQMNSISRLLQDKEKLKQIKDSYDKFRRETMDSINTINSVETYANEQFIEDRYNFDMKNLNDPFHDPSHMPNSDEMEMDVLEETKIMEKIKNISSSSSTKAATYKTKAKKSKKNLIDEAKEQEELILQGKGHSLTKLLYAHMDICVSGGSPHKANKILMYYRNRAKRLPARHPAVSNINVFNVLLTAYSRNGDYKELTDLLKILNEDNIELNAQSYAAIFECIERSDVIKKSEKFKEHLKIMQSKGITFNNIMNECKFVRDQKEIVLTAIRRMDPTFVPEYIKPKLGYICPLVANLNPSSSKKGVYNKTGKVSSPAEGVITAEMLEKKTMEQFANEIRGTVEIKNIEVNDNPSASVLYMRNKLDKLEAEWRVKIKQALLRNLSALKAQAHASNNALNIYPYLTSIDINDYVELMVLELRKLANGSETYSPTAKMLQRELGIKANYHYQIKKYKNNGTIDKISVLYKKYCEWYLKYDVNFQSEQYNPRRKWQELLYTHQEGASLDGVDSLWPNSVCIALGKFLYDILIGDVKIDANIFKKDASKPKYFPVLYNIFRGKGKLVRHEVKLYPLYPRLLRESQPIMLSMETILVPSLCPPLPWSDYLHGGYLLTQTSVMRIAYNGQMQIDRLKEADPQNLFPSLDNLNQLGAVPWLINKPILDILLHVFKSGGSHTLKVARPAHSVPQPPPPNSSLSKKERAAAMKQRAALARVRQEMHSQWCDMLYKLSLANHYRDEIFWLPHNMDFRGRVYPCPPHLSHLSADSSRALLVFARGKPLGPNGLKWLKLHCINLTGTMKKSTVDERLSHVDSIMDDILDSADRPLEGRRWWVKSDDPWQTLAACKEIANAIRSPNPEEYICHFPVHQDGSCNGLQHYAALGGDSAGAFSVNLTEAERPQDVYSAVVNLVEAARVNDAANNVQIAQVLEGFIRRKVIKQTVMTTVYGVTKFGARLQIAKQLKDIDAFPKEHVWLASSYLTNKTFDSLQQMFTSTKEIQDWFTECAKTISGVCGAKIEWVTPLGLPIVQPYHKRSKLVNYHNKGKLNEYISYDQYEKPCSLKQKNAFPPNFIHSLDSTHMTLTSLHCEMSDITFMSVHDCFWTHPSTVEIMNKVCREQFVSLYSQPILEKLSEDLISRYSFDSSELSNSGTPTDLAKQKLNILLRKLPPKGDFDLKNVLKSVYFFS